MTEPRTPDPSSAQDPAPPVPDAVQPPPVAPGSDTPPVPWEPTSGASPSGPRWRPRSWIFTVALVLVVATLVATGVRILSRQASSFLGSAFAGSDIWQRLPADSRDDFERRIKAAAGDLQRMSDEEAGKQVQTRIKAGMLRLDDAVLVRRLTLQTLALGKLDDATCGQFAQESFAGRPQPEAVALKLIGAMTEVELREWFEVAVLALEADAHKSPEARSVSEAETGAVFERLLGSLDSTSLLQIQTGAATTASPAEACVGARAMYDAIEQLPDPDRRLIALADVAL